MKTKALLLSLLIGLSAVIFSSCDDDEETATLTGISFAMDTIEIEIEAAQALEVTFEPDGTSADLTWASSTPSVATVSAMGIVTGISVGTTTVVASTGIFNASVVISVTPKEIDPNDLPSSLQGSNYHLIHIDETSYEFVKTSVDNDFRPDDDSKNLYVWENTFTAGSSAGLNFYGQSEGWISLVVASVGWSGAGFNVGETYGDIDMTDLAANADDYVFHVAMKSSGSAPYLFILTDGFAEVKVNIGSSSFVDGGITYPAYKDFTRDNEWHEVEIPVSYLKSLGLNFDSTFTNKNIFAFLAGGAGGTTMDMDAIFYYKKAK